MASRALAKVHAKAKEAFTGLSGYPGIFSHLAGEHAEVGALMKQVAGSTGSAVADELFPEIRDSLLAHARAEEKEFYPRLRNAPATQKLITKALEEHRKVQEYLQQLDVGNRATKSWMTLFERMMRAVEAHVSLEENRIFPAAKDVLGNEQAKDIEKRYAATEAQEKARL